MALKPKLHFGESAVLGKAFAGARRRILRASPRDLFDVFFGLVGGLVAFALTEACLLALDWMMPDDDDAAGVVR